MDAKFSVKVIYNGITKPIEVEPDEQIAELLKRAIQAFGITSNPHTLSLFREDGTKVEEHESVHAANLHAGQELLLRPDAVKGGG